MVTHTEDADLREIPWTAERLCRASYQELGSPTEVEAMFKHHLLTLPSCRLALQHLLASEIRTTRDFSLEIDAFDLLEANPVLGHMLLKFPNTLVPLLENAILRAQNDLKQELEAEEESAFAASLSRGMEQEGDYKACPRSVKGATGTRVHARIFHLPPTCCRTSVASMSASDVGKIVQVSGTCVRTSPVQMYESARTYKCSGKNGCSRIFPVFADLEQRNNAMVKPDRCPLYTESATRCKGTNLQLEENGSVHTDYQEIKIQEVASKIGVGHIPRSLLIKLQHDLVDKCQPGDEVIVVGILLAQWQQSAQPGLECNVGMALKAHSVRVIQENGWSAWQQTDAASSIGELEKFRKEFDAFWDESGRREHRIAARDFICKSVCPKLYGLDVIKLALLITLIGGVSSSACERNDESTTTGIISAHASLPSKGMIHHELHDRKPEPFRMIRNEAFPAGPLYSEKNQSSRYRQWKQTNATVQTRRRDMSHILIIGDPGTGKSQILRFAAALCPRAVLTTGVGTTSAGLTCAAVREGNDKDFALEAGALVLADKGICCIDEFGCIRSEDRTTIHEAMEQQTLSVAKAGIVCKLNCRATVIAVMNPRHCIYDPQSSLAQNTGLGTPLLSRFDLIFKLVDTPDAERDSNVTSYLLNRAIAGTGFECTNTSSESGEEVAWSMEKLRAYIAIVKDRFHPTISDEAALLLERHYEKVRSAKSFVIPVTVRFLESLIRLTQAHARLLYRNLATLQDAVAVLRVMECSAYAYGGFDANVDDIENVLYCDPMTADTSGLTPDEDFVVFEYRILKRYDLLEYMSNDLRKRAMALLEGEYNIAEYNQSVEWHNIDNQRDRQHAIFHDHYGRSYFSSATQNTPQSDGKRRRLS